MSKFQHILCILFTSPQVNTSPVVYMSSQDSAGALDGAPFTRRAAACSLIDLFLFFTAAVLSRGFPRAWIGSGALSSSASTSSSSSKSTVASTTASPVSISSNYINITEKSESAKKFTYSSSFRDLKYRDGILLSSHRREGKPVPPNHICAHNQINYQLTSLSSLSGATSSSSSDPPSSSSVPRGGATK